jgi:hypothetical protein
MDDPKSVLSRLPPCVVKHPAKMKELRAQWDVGCSKILYEAQLSQDQKIQVVMTWLAKAGVRDFVLGSLLVNWSRPLPVQKTEDERKEKRQKSFVKMAYTDDLPHLRAVNKIVTNRLESLPANAAGSLRSHDAIDDREVANPGTMFAEFAKSIEEQVAIEYQSSEPGDVFAHAAE